MAVGGAQGIGGIHELRHFVFLDVEHALQHCRHLFLGSLSLSGDSHLDFQWSIFVDGHVVVDGGSDGNALGSSQLEHRLHVLSEERCLNRHLVGQVGVDDARHPLEDLAQSQIGVLLLAHVDDAHHHQLCLVARHANHAVAHHVGTRVNAQDYLFRIRFRLCF